MEYKLPTFLFIGGFLFITLSAILGWVIAPFVIDEIMGKQFIIEPGTEIYEQWLDIPLPIYLKFYIFNLTNPDEFLEGGKPNYTEIGPFVYSEKRSKVDLVHRPNEGLLDYREYLEYQFVPELSVATDETRITTVNFPLLVLAVLGVHYFGIPITNIVLEEFMADGNENLIWHKIPVRALIFDGLEGTKLETYLKLFNITAPPEFQGGKFGFWRGRNNTASGLYTIKSGKGNYKEVGQTVSFEGMTKLDWWLGKYDPWNGDTSVTDYCNQIKGSSGIFFPPQLTKKSILWIFYADACRSLYLKFREESSFKGIPSYQFEIPREVFASADEVPENKCFCPKVSPRIETLCNISGLMRMHECKYGFPIAMSLPHFMNSDPLLREMVIGMNPDKRYHDSIVEVNPVAGIPLSASLKIQGNLEIFDVPGIDLLKGRPYTALPICWVDLVAELDDDFADDVKRRFITPMKILDIGKWVILGVSIAVFLTSFLIAYVQIKKRIIIV